jgi:hypothetical protein
METETLEVIEVKDTASIVKEAALKSIVAGLVTVAITQMLPWAVKSGVKYYKARKGDVTVATEQ